MKYNHTHASDHLTYMKWLFVWDKKDKKFNIIIFENYRLYQRNWRNYV